MAKELVKKKQAGMREGINKEDIVKSFTEEDWKHIKLMKDVERNFVDNDLAYKFAIRTDQMYQEWDKTLDGIDLHLYNILSMKVRIDKNKSDIAVGETERKYQESNLSIRDLEIENINMNRNIRNSIRDMYLLLTDLYRYAGQQRLDKVIFFTKEECQKVYERVIGELKKNGIDLFAERHTVG